MIIVCVIVYVCVCVYYNNVWPLDRVTTGFRGEIWMILGP